MSHYKPYPAYRDSGVEWIGQVPEHWEVKRLRHVASFKNSNVDKKAYEGQEAVSLCNYTDVYYNEFITPDLPFMQATASATEIEQFSLRKGDVIITKDSEDPSDIGIPSLVKNDLPGVICGYHLTMIRGADFDTSRLLHRILQSNPTQAHFYVEAPGITRYGLSQDAIGDLPVNLPPENERNGIANAVDRETTRIDALITKKTRFIELLKEKRQALITHAVTKGLDPNVKMKDSGVEWIGEVPEHWDVKPLKIIASCNDDSLPESMPLDMPIRYVDISAVSHDGGISRAESMMFGDAPSRARRRAKLGDVVVSTVRTYLKAVASVDEAHTDCVYSTGFAVLRARSEQLAPEFLKWLVLNDLLIQAVESHSEGLSYPAINSSELVNLKTVVPGLPEQKRIAATLDRETSRIDLLTEKTQRSIDLLKERRAAFITAAVTGQIDLRESA
ncbi:restriction endonuclease subunit S [Nitrosomonas mobilis]|uniref:Type I restriction modification DNA specificity domain-containing protein n=1 Tax=Nitrosomonas mobilis TaxID=51642 RepID=A0A1G5SGS8_9PROT|nr:restriction endonuclease subunit S [Nitrosomonas mobilis]SCZ86403.1 conserved hypothetical protein [Nitrosomonas mobilis]